MFTGHGFNPTQDDMNIIFPPVFWRRKIGTTSLARRYEDFTFTFKIDKYKDCTQSKHRTEFGGFTSNILSHISSETSSIGPKPGLTAAFEINTSILPNLSKVVSNRVRRSSADETWHLTPMTSFQPFCFSDSSASVTLSCFRLLITTFAPSCSRRSAAHKPILYGAHVIETHSTQMNEINDKIDRDSYLPGRRCGDDCNFTGEPFRKWIRCIGRIAIESHCYGQSLCRQSMEIGQHFR